MPGGEGGKGGGGRERTERGPSTIWKDASWPGEGVMACTGEGDELSLRRGDQEEGGVVEGAVRAATVPTSIGVGRAFRVVVAPFGRRGRLRHRRKRKSVPRGHGTAV